MTLQFVGAGVLDESEINPARTVTTTQQTPIPIAPIPTVVPTSKPGKDITELTVADLRGAIKELQKVEIKATSTARYPYRYSPVRR